MPDEMPSLDPRNKKVLIVDDDEGILNLVELLVRREGFQALVASSGETAIAKLGERPDALILDLIMPGCGGLGVLKHMKTLPPPAPPIIVITAYEKAHSTVKEAITDPLVSQCLSKPLNHDTLVAALHRYLKTAPVNKLQ